MRLLIQHESRYDYATPAALGPHLIRLRPANHSRARIESYTLKVQPEHAIRWQQDPYGNHLARVTFEAEPRVSAFQVLVQIAVDVRPVNPFDFFIDDACKELPFAYPPELRAELSPFLVTDEPFLAGGARLNALLRELPSRGPTIDTVVEMNRLVNQKLKYVIREEPGIWTPEETLEHGRGSCRDSAVLLIAALRSRGLAARFVSGYLVQLRDEGMIPDEPRGVDRDVVDLHAWAEVYLPGGGWVGLDATSGLLCGEGHIPLACAASPSLASPIDGTSDVAASKFSFSMVVGRLGHEPRPTAPYVEETWVALLHAGAVADERIEKKGLALTQGGEPTFNARERPEAPEWNGEALGPAKWELGLKLCGELRRRLSPHAAVLARMGKHYPGESLPRWSLDICGRRDGKPAWTGLFPPAARQWTVPQGIEMARRFAEALAAELGVEGHVHPAFEDPWSHIQAEARVPVEVDPLKADLTESEERRRLARVLDRGLGREAGFVLPLIRKGDAWNSARWGFRRGHLFLLPGDSPIGLRLPLGSLSPGFVPSPPEPRVDPPDPRRGEDAQNEQARIDVRSSTPSVGEARTALCVEPKDGVLRVFLPPLTSAEDFFLLVNDIDAVRADLGVGVLLEGYPPPKDPALYHFAVTPDPGVLEVNLPPSSQCDEHARLLETVFEAALSSGLHAEKYMLDGRVAGSGGGHHLTLGGPTVLQSPFVQRPDLLASLTTFLQHHPSLSYLFTGLFVGPTSQAPRVDEARHDSLYELEIALDHAFERASPPPWLADSLFRDLLVDVSGNTHRTELSIDKLFDWRTPHGRQGLIELRAFEMPPHPRMAAAQVILLRSLMASFAEAPYHAPLVRWGSGLHDRFLLPYWLWRDFEEVLQFLADRGLPLPAEGYRPFLELRCPLVGRLEVDGLVLELRNALEPWPVLGEEPAGGGTSRFVDSSMERVELRVFGLVPERHDVLVNGLTLPLRETGVAGERVAGVRFRAWAPPRSLQAHLGIHHPLRFDLFDRWSKRSLGAFAYHVWHPEGRGYSSPPLTRFEAAARRAQRFTLEGPLPYPVKSVPVAGHPDAPYTLDLRRFTGDRPMPEPEKSP